MTLIRILKPLMPILSAVYGVAVIYVTALPVADDKPTFVGELLTWLLTLAGIALAFFLVHRVEPKVFPSARRFSLKLPKISVIVGLSLIAPLWLVSEEYIVYGITSLTHNIYMEPLIYTTAEFREDILSSVHAVFTRGTVFQADGYLPLPPPWCTDCHLCRDGYFVRNAPRA